jgi:hypothetical protein
MGFVADAPITVAALRRFHREVLLPDPARIASGDPVLCAHRGRVGSREGRPAVRVIAVSNASPLISLHRVDGLELLRQLFTGVLVPPGVGAGTAHAAWLA